MEFYIKTAAACHKYELTYILIETSLTLGFTIANYNLFI